VPLTTQPELVSAVADFIHRTDLNARIPDFVTLAEAKMSSDIVARAMETSATLTATAGVSTVALPADFMRPIRLKLDTTPSITLKYGSPDEVSASFTYSTAGRPVIFTVLGSNLELAPPPDSGYSLVLDYVRKIPALTVDNPTNWLLTAWPNTYLYGTLLQAAMFLEDDARTGKFTALYQEAVANINKIDWYSGTTMRVRAG
jgi:hypothetical protein